MPENRFLAGHGPLSVRDRLLRLADSPLATERNDHYGKGGVVQLLEARVADLLGKESAVFMPSGTMAQPIALRIWADQSGRKTVAWHPLCHLQIHEQMGFAELHHLESILLGEPNRLFTLADLQRTQQAIGTLLIELPQREIGGQLPSWTELTEVCAFARTQGIRLHMDGARLWECQPFYDRTYAEIAALFDSVYVSFYKILGGLPGAILAGPTTFIDEARIWQRRQGGNLHQQSPSAINAMIGLDEELPRISSFVTKASEIAQILSRFDQVKVVPEAPPTNMMHLHFSGDHEKLVAAAKQIAEEDQVTLFSWLHEGKTELTVASAALNLDNNEIEALFTKFFALVSS